MITNKDIRVENGYLIINGDKYPLDGQSPEAIMEIVEDNSDTTPTENSTAPITSGGVFTALATKTGTITLNSGWSFQGGSNSCVKKVGDIAWLSAYIQNENDLTVNTVYQVGTLPEGFRPQKSYSFPIFLKDQSTIRGIVTIENSGIIYFRSVDGSKWILFTTIMFPLT